jgi:hypothetical protein
LGFGVGLDAGETVATAICGDDDATICGEDDAAICGDDDAASGGAADAAIAGSDDTATGDADDAAISGDDVAADATGEVMLPSGAADPGDADADGELAAVPSLVCEPVQALARKRHAMAATVSAPNEAAGVFKALDSPDARRSRRPAPTTRR